MRRRLEITYKFNTKYTTKLKVKSGCCKDAINREKETFFIIDDRVARLYPELVKDGALLVKAGENLKGIAGLEGILGWLTDKGCRRDNSLTVMGGGSLCDLAGFAASIYLRGIKWNVIPTTLMAMVDSSIGGETSINIHDIKDQVGSIHQPAQVLIDPLFLETLSSEDYLSGLAEIIKIAAVTDKELFNILLLEHKKIKSRDMAVMPEVIMRACMAKAALVCNDPYEGYEGMLVKAGHTVGYVIETDSEYNISHGQAVAIGLLVETQLGEKFGHVKKGTAAKIEEMLELYGYDLSYVPVQTQTMYKNLRVDRKSRSDGIYMAFVKTIGNGVIKKIRRERLINMKDILRQ